MLLNALRGLRKRNKGGKAINDTEWNMGENYLAGRRRAAKYTSSSCVYYSQYFPYNCIVIQAYSQNWRAHIS